MVNTPIQVKRTSVTGRTPNTTGSYATNSQYIATGELALNLTDGKMFSSNGTNFFEVGANLINQYISNSVNIANTLFVTGIITTNNTTTSQGTNASFQIYDRSGNANGAGSFYRSNQINYFYDSTGGNVLQYTSANISLLYPTYVSSNLNVNNSITVSNSITSNTVNSTFYTVSTSYPKFLFNFPSNISGNKNIQFLQDTNNNLQLQTVNDTGNSTNSTVLVMGSNGVTYNVNAIFNGILTASNGNFTVVNTSILSSNTTIQGYVQLATALSSQTQAIIPPSTQGLGVGWNYTGGQAEVDLFSLYNNGTNQCFNFYQKANSTFVNLLASLSTTNANFPYGVSTSNLSTNNVTTNTLSVNSSVTFSNTLIVSGSITSNTQIIATGNSAQIAVYDHSGSANGYATFYRNLGINYFYDSTGRNILQYSNNSITLLQPTTVSSNLSVTGVTSLAVATANTVSINDNSNNIATTAFVKSGIPFVTPEMFGALGNGTNDDSAAIQAAINSSNSMVIFSAKNYYIQNTISISTNTIIQGAGRGLTNITFNNNIPNYTTANGIINIKAQCEIRDILFVATQPQPVSNLSSLYQYPPIIFMQGVPAVTLDRVGIYNALTCIDARGNCGQSRFRDLQLSAYQFGLRIDGSLDTIIIRDVHAYVYYISNTTLQTTNVTWLDFGRVDDLKVDCCCLFQGNIGMNFYSSISQTTPYNNGGGGAATGTATNIDFDFNNFGLVMTGGDLSIHGGYFATPAGSLSVNMNAGFLGIHGATGGKFLNQGGTIKLDGCYFLCGNTDSYIYQQQGSTSLSQIESNIFAYTNTSNTNLTIPKINVTAGRTQIIGNYIVDRASGTGTTFANVCSGYNKIVMNTMPGWSNILSGNTMVNNASPTSNNDFCFGNY